MLSFPDNLSLRGYINAFATGILLSAALKFIPTTLSDLEFASYTLVSDYLISPGASGSGLAAWPAYFQVLIRSFGVMFILLLFLHGNSSLLVSEQEDLSEHSKTPNWRKRLALPPADQIDRAGFMIITGGLFCYNLWLGANQASLLRDGRMLIGSIPLIFFGAALGLANWGLLPDPRRQWRWLAGSCLLLGLAVILGVIGPVGRLVLMISPLVLLPGTACLIYGIGRLLRIVQNQIALEWRTTLVVAIGTAAVYFGSQLFSRLI